MGFCFVLFLVCTVKLPSLRYITQGWISCYDSSEKGTFKQENCQAPFLKIGKPLVATVLGMGARSCLCSCNPFLTRHTQEFDKESLSDRSAKGILTNYFMDILYHSLSPYSPCKCVQNFTIFHFVSCYRSHYSLSHRL